MNTEYRKIIDHYTKNQSFDESVITLFNMVRDIPYGAIGSRDPLAVFKHKKGTCSGKHELLKGLYKTLGLEVKDFIIMHAFNNLTVDYPSNIQCILSETTIVDPHNFLKIKRNNQWLIIDVTWDIGLKKVGFPVNENWNGFESMKISVAESGEFFETEKPLQLKKQLIAELPENVQISRKLFLKEVTSWLEKVR